MALQNEAQTTDDLSDYDDALSVILDEARDITDLQEVFEDAETFLQYVTWTDLFRKLREIAKTAKEYWSILSTIDRNLLPWDSEEFLRAFTEMTGLIKDRDDLKFCIEQFETIDHSEFKLYDPTTFLKKQKAYAILLQRTEEVLRSNT